MPPAIAVGTGASQVVASSVSGAIAHWQRYLELDAGSPWARIARAHLEFDDIVTRAILAIGTQARTHFQRARRRRPVPDWVIGLAGDS